MPAPKVPSHRILAGAAGYALLQLNTFFDCESSHEEVGRFRAGVLRLHGGGGNMTEAGVLGRRFSSLCCAIHFSVAASD
jgi:hypothetical protein